MPAGQSAVTRRGLITLPSRGLALVDSPEQISRSPRRREALRRRLLCTADVVAAAVALVFVLGVLGNDQLKLITLAATPLVILLFKVAGLYDREQLRLLRSTLDEAPVLVQISGLYALSVAILQSFILKGDGHLWGGQIAALWLVSCVAIVAGRVAARWLAGRASAIERCLVIGDPGLALQIRDKLASSGARALVAATLPLEANEVDRLEGPEGVRRLVDELQVERIIIAPATSEPVTELIRLAKSAGVQVSLLPRMLEVVGSAVEFENIDGLTMLGVRPFGLTRSSRVLKRTFDLISTSIGLFLVLPVIAAIAAAIRLDSRGPVFFRQVRIGRDGRPFRIFKFRSMVVGAEAQRDGLRSLNEVGDGMFKITSDPRVTRVGTFLRRTSLDELPQLFNVMLGEMSLVGPRPLVTDEDALVLGLDRSRLHLTPGMTGPWQVLGSRVPMKEMVGLDYLYVANWSLWLDLKLLLHTVRHVLRRGNV